MNTWRKQKNASDPKPPESAFPAERPIKAFMGWDGVMIWDESVNIVDMARSYMEQAAKESCGQCFPCRLGTERMSRILNNICQGKGKEADLASLETLARQVHETARCDIGRTSPLPILDLLTHRKKDFLKVIEQGLTVERRDYTARVTAPCMNACPSHVNIPGYLEQIRFDRWDKALAIVRQDCPMPGTIGRVCVRPCEFNCQRTKMEEPLAIKSLKRFIADQEIAHKAEPEFETAAAKPEKVAVIGAGPAGVSCAFYLGQNGYKCTVFEKDLEPGGMAAFGIPDYRLPRPVLRREAEIIKGLGAEIQYGKTLGEDFTVQSLLDEGYKAVFLGLGAPAASSMRCEGEDACYMGFLPGIDYLRQAAENKKPLSGDQILIIGGGNVAMDCARTARRHGFKEVHVIYRRTRAEMPADHVEIEEAEEEGVQFHFLVAPLKIQAKNEKITSLKCQRMELGEPDDSGRRRPVPIEGETYEIECDAIVPAIGQVCCVDIAVPEAETTRWKTLVADEATGQCTNPPLFGGGDCLTGPSSLIAALAAGKRAAYYMTQYMEGESCTISDKDLMDSFYENLGVFNFKEKLPCKGFSPRLPLPALSPEERVKNFEEVEEGYTPEQARSESARCLRCYRIGVAALGN